MELPKKPKLKSILLFLFSSNILEPVQDSTVPHTLETLNKEVAFTLGAYICSWQ